MPSGEVFTGPHETSANGRVRFTLRHRAARRRGRGRRARAPRRRGRRRATPTSGEELPAAARWTRTPARDGSASSGVGTNFGIDRATGSILLDEKIGGTIHLALGRSYPETGGTNESALHWDLVCDLREGGRLSADGEPVVEDGRIVTR